MTSSEIKQHLTVKNVFLAIVALNIFSAVSLSPIGGTFEEMGKPVVRPMQQSPAAIDPVLSTHMIPGEASPAQLDVPAAQPLPVWSKPPAQVLPPTKLTSNPPSVGWPMLLAVGAMALYVRYLMTRAVARAAGQAVDIVKQLASAIADHKPRPRAAPATAQAAKQPAKPVQTGIQAAAPRKSTVVRASRWPFAT